MTAEYYDPRAGDESPVVWGDRLAFLHRMADIAPGVLEALRDEVLPLCARYGERWENVEESQDVEVAIQAWAHKWHLMEPWLLNAALATLRLWCSLPQTLAYTPLRFQAAPRIGGAVYELDDVQPCYPFRPTMESRASFDARVEQWKRSNYEAAAKLANVHALKPARKKNAPRRTNDANLHFEWLVRYQVQEWTHAQIARRYDRSYDKAKRVSPAIANALRATAARIGLTLR